MTAELLTDAGLAEVFGVAEQKIGEWRRAYGWPHVKVGRQVRYTAAHVEQIVSSHSHDQRPAPQSVSVEVPGQTARSARRRRSA